MVCFPSLLITLEENRAASLSVYPRKSASPSYRACRDEAHEEPLEHRESVQERLFSDWSDGDRLQREQ